MTRLLFRIEWQQFRNKRGFGGGKDIVLSVVAVILGLVALSILGAIGLALGRFVGIEGVNQALSIVFLAAGVFILLFGIPQVFKNLFSSRDLELLFTMPISTKSIFWVKYVQSFFSIAGVIWLLVFIPFIAFGIGAGCSWLYYPVLFLVSAGIMVIAVSLAYLFNLGLIQILPASRAKELMTVMTAMAGILVYVLIQVPNFAIQGGLSSTGFTLPGLPAWLPTTLGGQGLAESADGGFSALLPTAIVVCIAVFLAYLSSTLVERGFRTGWIRLSEGGRRKKIGQKKRGIPPLRHPVIFLGIKEWRGIQRDLREWMMFLPSLFVPAILFGEIFLNGSTEIFNHDLLLWLLTQGVLLLGFSQFSAQITLASVGREGKAAWILRVAPLTGRQIALGKLWIGWLISLIVFCVLEIVLGVIFTWSLLLILAGIAVFALMSLGMNGIGLWIGTMGAKYNPNKPRDRVAGGSRYLLLLADLLYFIIAAIPGIVILLPVQYEPFIAEFAGNGGSFITFVFHLADVMLLAKVSHETLIVVLGVLCLLVFSLGVTALTLHLCAKRFDKGVHIQIVQSTGGKGKGMMGSPLTRRKLK